MAEVLGDPLKIHRTWKNHLPSYFLINRFRFDIEKLREETRKLDSHFSHVFKANKELCKNHPNLTEAVQGHYLQVGLTVLNPEFDGIGAEDCEDPHDSLSKIESYKIKISPRTDHPGLDERNYNYPTEEYKGSYFEECVSSFGEEPMRVRLVKLKSGEKVDFHIDYDPSFAMRIVVPIFTNPKVLNITKRKKEIEKVQLPADGRPWFLNTGFSHAVENNGNEDRIILMFSLKPSRLLLDISNAWKSGQSHLD